MPFKIVFNRNDTWFGGARIPVDLVDMSNLSSWIKKFINYFNNLGIMYNKYFQNDGELIGQEKANLVKALDGLLGGIILLRNYITKDCPYKFESLCNKYNYWFEIKIDNINWRGKGKMSSNYAFDNYSFADWYNIMIKKIQKVFRDYSKAMEDGILTANEANTLNHFIESIIYEILVIEKVLISTDLDH